MVSSSTKVFIEEQILFKIEQFVYNTSLFMCHSAWEKKKQKGTYLASTYKKENQ